MMSRELDTALAEILDVDINHRSEYSTCGIGMLELDRMMRKRGWQIDGLYCRNNVCPGITSFSCSYSRKNKYGEREFVHSDRVDNEPLARALAAYEALAGKKWEGEQCKEYIKNT